MKEDVQGFLHVPKFCPNNFWRLSNLQLSAGLRQQTNLKGFYKGIYTAIHTECHACIESWHLFGKLPDSMSLSSAFRNCLDKILVRGESPERPLSSRTKIMSNVRATRKFCPVKKSSVYFASAVTLWLIPESRFRNLLMYWRKMRSYYVLHGEKKRPQFLREPNRMGCLLTSTPW